MRSFLRQMLSDEDSLLEFQKQIDILRKDCDSYSEAIAFFLEKHDMEYHEVLPLISNKMIEQMREESIQNRMLRIKDDVLPI